MWSEGQKGKKLYSFFFFLNISLLCLPAPSCLRVLLLPLSWNAQHKRGALHEGTPQRWSALEELSPSIWVFIYFSKCFAFPAFMSSGTISPSEFPAVSFHLSSHQLWRWRWWWGGWWKPPPAWCRLHSAAGLWWHVALRMLPRCVFDAVPLGGCRWALSLSDWPLLRFSSHDSLHWAISLKIKAAALW